MKERVMEFCDCYLEETKINKHLMRDVEGVIGSLHRLNAKNAIGYSFYATGNHRSIYRGSYTHYLSDLATEVDDFYYDFKNKKFYKIVRKSIYPILKWP